MSDKTTNYNFDTPGLDGAANIEVQDANWEKADTAIAAKVDKVEGKSLSTNDYTDSEKAEVAKIKDKVDKAGGLPYELTLILNNTESKYKGTSSVKKEWYAPVTSGSQGQVLKSNGSGAPVWSDETPQKNFYITVAASSAPAEIKKVADYVCDGISDDVEINTALKASFGTENNTKYGKTVLLSPGVFNISAPIILNGANNLFSFSGTCGNTLQGSGINTVLKRSFAAVTAAPTYYSDTSAIITITAPSVGSTAWRVCDLTIDCGYSEYNSDTAPYMNGIGFRGNTEPMTISNVNFTNYKNAVAVPNGNIIITDCTFASSQNNAFYSQKETTLTDKSGSLYALFHHNRIYGKIDIKLSDNNNGSSSNMTNTIVIRDNTFKTIDIRGESMVGSVLKYTTVIIENNNYDGFVYNYSINNVNKVILSGNVISDGQCLSGNNFVIVTGNIIGYLSLYGTNGATVCNNIFYSSNTSFYGIAIGTTAKNCLIANNILSSDNYISDSGTGTVLANNVVRGE